MVTNDPRRIHPDFFPPTEHNTYANDAPTAPLVGGERTPGAHEISHGLPTQPATENVQASAALQRDIAQTSPRPVRLRGAGVVPASGTLVLGMGGPAAGFEWIVRRVNVGPLDYSAGGFPASGVTVILSVSGDKISSPPDSAYEVVSVSSVYPAEGTWGRDELHLAAGEVLRVTITGLAAAVQVTSGGLAFETATGVVERYQL